MPNVGFAEIAVVAILALIIFGPKRLPELGRSLGKGIREFRSSVSGEAGDDDAAKSQIGAGTQAPGAEVPGAEVPGTLTPGAQSQGASQPSAAPADQQDTPAGG